jgi:hypothetical protein
MLVLTHRSKQFSLKTMQCCLQASVSYFKNQSKKSNRPSIDLTVLLTYKPAQKDMKALRDLSLIQDVAGLLLLNLEINHSDWNPKTKSMYSIGNLPLHFHLAELQERVLDQPICAHSTLWLSQRVKLTRLEFGKLKNGLIDFHYAGVALDKDGPVLVHANEKLPIKIVVTCEKTKDLTGREFGKEIESFLFSELGLQRNSLIRKKTDALAHSFSAVWKPGN